MRFKKGPVKKEIFPNIEELNLFVSGKKIEIVQIEPFNSGSICLWYQSSPYEIRFKYGQIKKELLNSEQEIEHFIFGRREVLHIESIIPGGQFYLWYRSV